MVEIVKNKWSNLWRINSIFFLKINSEVEAQMTSSVGSGPSQPTWTIPLNGKRMTAPAHNPRLEVSTTFL